MRPDRRADAAIGVDANVVHRPQVTRPRRSEHPSSAIWKTPEAALQRTGRVRCGRRVPGSPRSHRRPRAPNDGPAAIATFICRHCSKPALVHRRAAAARTGCSWPPRSARWRPRAVHRWPSPAAMEVVDTMVHRPASPGTRPECYPRSLRIPPTSAFDATSAPGGPRRRRRICLPSRSSRVPCGKCVGRPCRNPTRSTLPSE